MSIDSIKWYRLYFLSVDWSSSCSTFQTIDQHDQQFLLESALSRVLLIDVATYSELSSPYVRYIFENYFANQEEHNQVKEAIRFIESLELDRSQASQVKLLVLLQSGTQSPFKLTIDT